MIIQAARLSLANLLAPETRAVFWKVLGLTILVLVGLWLALRQTFAMRFRPPPEARAFRAKHRGTVFLAGLLIAGFLAIPIVNLLTPLFAAGLMVHLHKLVSRRDPTFDG